MSPIIIVSICSAVLSVVIAYVTFRVSKWYDIRKRQAEKYSCGVFATVIGLLFLSASWAVLAITVLRFIPAQSMLISSQGEILATFDDNQSIWRDDYDALLKQGELVSYATEKHTMLMMVPGYDWQLGCVLPYYIRVTSGGSPTAAIKYKQGFSDVKLIPWLSCELYKLQEENHEQISETFPTNNRVVFVDAIIRSQLTPKLREKGLQLDSLWFKI